MSQEDSCYIDTVKSKESKPLQLGNSRGLADFLKSTININSSCFKGKGMEFLQIWLSRYQRSSKYGRESPQKPPKLSKEIWSIERIQLPPTLPEVLGPVLCMGDKCVMCETRVSFSSPNVWKFVDQYLAVLATL